MSWSAFGQIRRATLDNVAGVVEVVGADGRLLRAEHPLLTTTLGPGLPDDFDRLSLDVERKILSLTLPRGDEVEIEFYDRDDDAHARRAGRPAVYLDQNKWVALAQAIHSPHRLSPEERAASRELIRLVEANEIIILLSSAHMLETGRTDGAWRDHLAPLMLRLSRGWVLRDPLQVRHAELSTMMAAQAGVELAPPPMITLDPDALYSNLPTPGQVTSARRSPSSDGLDEVAGVLGHVASIYAVLLENVKIISSEGELATQGWAEWQEVVSRGSADNRATTESLRQYTLTAYLRDMVRDIALAASRVGATEEHLATWLSGCDDALAEAPYLGRVRDLMHRRHSNPAERWEPNDLVDVMYLPLAATFADLAVMEQKAAHYLRLGQRKRGGALIVTSLVAAVESLNSTVR